MSDGRDDTKPGRDGQRTFVLIPGAGGTEWYWHGVVPLLQDAGHRAIPVDLPADNPAAGLAEYAQLVTEAADGSSNLTLVAQSLGGFTAPLAAMKTDVRALVFVNAMIPLPGETPGEWWDATGWEEARRAAAEPYQRAESDSVFASVCDFGDWPIKVAAGADDRFFPASFQQAVARDRLGVEPDLVPGGHMNALSRPAELVSYLLAI